MAPTLKLSGLQKQVLGLYRQFLRAARLKGPEERHRITSIVSTEFHHNAKAVDRKNFLHIEYLLRRGKKQLDQLRSPGTVGLSTLKVSTRMPMNAPFQAGDHTPSSTLDNCDSGAENCSINENKPGDVYSHVKS